VNLEQLDELLHRYTEAEQRIAGTLVELEARPTYKLIMSGPQRGATGARLQAAIASVPELWRAFDSLRDVLARARTVRGTGRRVTDDEREHLEVLLAGPSILVDVEQLPVEQRTLLGATEKQTWLSPEQLLAQMSATFDTVAEGVAAVEQVWRDIVPRLDAANGALTQLDQTATGLGATDEPSLATLRDAIGAVERTLAEDPLGLGANATAQLDAAVAIAQARVHELATGQSSLEQDLERATALLGELRRLRAEVHAAAGETAAKFTACRVVEAPAAALLDGPDGIGSDLDEVRSLRAAWQRQRRRLDAWFARAEPLAEQLRRDLVTTRAPLERRDELRGLLAAYRAKAGDTGVAEDERIAALSRAAHQQLHTAPTDLPRAEELVQALAAALRQSGADR
jgi:hypothetical protein